MRLKRLNTILFCNSYDYSQNKIIIELSCKYKTFSLIFLAKILNVLSRYFISYFIIYILKAFLTKKLFIM